MATWEDILFALANLALRVLFFVLWCDCMIRSIRGEAYVPSAATWGWVWIACGWAVYSAGRWQIKDVEKRK